MACLAAVLSFFVVFITRECYFYSRPCRDRCGMCMSFYFLLFFLKENRGPTGARFCERCDRMDACEFLRM